MHCIRYVLKQQETAETSPRPIEDLTALHVEQNQLLLLLVTLLLVAQTKPTLHSLLLLLLTSLVVSTPTVEEFPGPSAAILQGHCPSHAQSDPTYAAALLLLLAN